MSIMHSTNIFLNTNFLLERLMYNSEFIFLASKYNKSLKLSYYLKFHK